MRVLSDGVRTVIYAAGFIAFFWWLAINIQRLDQSIGGDLPSWTEIPGITLMIAGGILGLACLGMFVVRGRGTAAPFDPPQEFVAVGPYKLVRNPMYVGGLGVLFGFSLYLHSLAVLVFTAIVSSVLHLFVVCFEEPDLENRFGASYRHYKESVNRWIPRWKRKVE
jgi:protein-S-isoprenylcysteine O-methyltransferase Ste14